MNWFSWIKLTFLIHLKYWYCNSPYPIPTASRLPLLYLSNFPLANKNSSSTQSSSSFLSFSLFFSTPFYHTPQLLDIPNHMPSQSFLLSSYKQTIIPYWSKTLPTKKLSLYSRISFKGRKHGQQQIYLQYKLFWIIYTTVDALSCSQPYLCLNHHDNLHQN